MGRPSHTLVFYQGEDFIFEIQWVNNNQVPVVLTGFTAVAQVRQTFESVEVIHEFNSADDTITLENNGKITLVATAEETAAIEMSGTGRWDLELTSSDDQVYRLVQGSAKVSPEVTRV